MPGPGAGSAESDTGWRGGRQPVCFPEAVPGVVRPAGEARPDGAGYSPRQVYLMTE